jgi:NADH-quinone oxidoreductase subunit C
MPIPSCDRALQKCRAAFADQILAEGRSAGQHFLEVRRDRIHDFLRFLRDDPELRFDFLQDLCGVDYLNQGKPERFCVVYNLYSFTNRAQFRLKAFVPEEDPTIDSASDLWPAADWAERETYDFYGIVFKNHPDLRRIQLPFDYEGHPLRKDYPLTGRGERMAFPRYERPAEP